MYRLKNFDRCIKKRNNNIIIKWASTNAKQWKKAKKCMSSLLFILTVLKVNEINSW